MASDISPKAPLGTLWKPERKQPKERKPLKRSAMKPRAAAIRQIGKVGRQRLNDRAAKLRTEPARHDGKRQCYICLSWFLKVVLEHIFDASVYPELRSNPTNHKWACSPCNLNKKRGILTNIQVARVQAAMLTVEA